jgi:hypothetical protein
VRPNLGRQDAKRCTRVSSPTETPDATAEFLRWVTCATVLARVLHRNITAERVTARNTLQAAAAVQWYSSPAGAEMDRVGQATCSTLEGA